MALTFVSPWLPAARGRGVRRALAVAVIGGLVVATALTLVVIPAIYRIAKT